MIRRSRLTTCGLWILLATIVALSRLLAATPSSVAEETGDLPTEEVEPAAVRVLVIGDSFTAGVVSGRDAPHYVEILGRLLGSGFEVVQLGCSGSTVLDWTRPETVFELCWAGGAYDLLALPATPADIATILLGTNDTMGYMEGGCSEPPTACPVSPEQYGKSMNELIDRLISDGVRRVIAIKPPRSSALAVEMVERLRGYAAVLDGLCAAREEVTCGPDLFDLLDPDLDFADGNIHPDASGHRKIARALAPAVRSSAGDPRDSPRRPPVLPR